MQVKSVYLIGLGFISLLVFSSCDNSTVYSESETIPDSQWQDTDTLFAQFDVTDTQHYHNIFGLVRFSSLYPYSNIYFKYILVGPTGQKITEIKSFEVTDKAGKWLGKGFGDLHSYEFPLVEKLPIKQVGAYKIKIVPYMRREVLEGVHDKGIKVSIGQEIF